jgi:hypothetical protein
MGYMKISPDQYLGSQELNRLLYFMKDEGWLKFLKAITQSTGVCFTTPNSLKVSDSGTSGVLNIQGGYAIDSNYNVIFLRNQISSSFFGVTVPDDNIWYYVYIAYEGTNQEAGTVNIGSDGSITAVTTPDFSNVLRGLPSNPVKIKFPNSVVNVDEYEVLNVVSDSEAQLNVSNMTAETGAEYTVVGSFTPGVAINNDAKNIYFYDGWTLGISLAILDTGAKIPLARVKRNGTTIDVEDTRSIYKFKLVNQ